MNEQRYDNSDTHATTKAHLQPARATGHQVQRTALLLLLLAGLWLYALFAIRGTDIDAWLLVEAVARIITASIVLAAGFLLVRSAVLSRRLVFVGLTLQFITSVAAVAALAFAGLARSRSRLADAELLTGVLVCAGWQLIPVAAYALSWLRIRRITVSSASSAAGQTGDAASGATPNNPDGASDERTHSNARLARYAHAAFCTAILLTMVIPLLSRLASVLSTRFGWDWPHWLTTAASGLEATSLILGLVAALVGVVLVVCRLIHRYHRDQPRPPRERVVLLTQEDAAPETSRPPALPTSREKARARTGHERASEPTIATPARVHCDHRTREHIMDRPARTETTPPTRRNLTVVGILTIAAGTFFAWRSLQWMVTLATSSTPHTEVLAVALPGGVLRLMGNCAFVYAGIAIFRNVRSARRLLAVGILAQTVGPVMVMAMMTLGLAGAGVCSAENVLKDSDAWWGWWLLVTLVADVLLMFTFDSSVAKRGSDAATFRSTVLQELLAPRTGVSRKFAQQLRDLRTRELVLLGIGGVLGIAAALAFVAARWTEHSHTQFADFIESLASFLFPAFIVALALLVLALQHKERRIAATAHLVARRSGERAQLTLQPPDILITVLVWVQVAFAGILSALYVMRELS